MAQMIPRNLPDSLRDDNRLHAERAVYESLRDGLGDDFHVYWSRVWNRLPDDKSRIEGEIDFLVVHPDRGILCIEVKGGTISRDDQGNWTQTSRSGTVYRLKRGPLKQAAEGKHALADALKRMRILERRNLNMAHGAVLPDTARPKQDIWFDLGLDFFAFGADMPPERLAAWVEGLLALKNKDKDPLGPEGIRALHEIVAASFELRPHLARALSEDMRVIERLTAEQALVMDGLAANPRIAIAGTAGTGKTVLALERAMRCVEAEQRTLLTCFNNALAAHLRGLVAKAGTFPNLVVASFHELCGSMAGTAGVALPPASTPGFYDTILPEALITSIETDPALAFDAIVVDEGQDFAPLWYDALVLSLNGGAEGKGMLAFFHDDNQRLYARAGDAFHDLPQFHFRLNRNLRNTRMIHEALQPWYDGQHVVAAGPRGEPVRWVRVATSDAAYTQASAFVKDLVEKEQLAASDIAILTGGTRDDCRLFAQKTIGGAIPVSATEQGRKGTIVCDTIRRFKGLERKCVVLVDIDRITNNELIYVGLSRASLLLMVIGREGDLERLKAG